MTLTEIIAGLDGKEIDSGVIDAIKALDGSAETERLTKELEAERGKNAGILEDKRKYKARADTAEGELKNLADSKLPEDERHLKALEAMQEQLDTAKAERDEDAKKFASSQREAKLLGLTGSIKWADGTPPATARLIVQSAMADFDDLDDKKVAEALEGIKESHKSFIASSAPSGAGSSSGTGNAGEGGEKPSIAGNQKAIWGDK